MTAAYCTTDDIFQLALAAQAFVTRPRPVTAADVNAATGAIRLKAHGLSVSDILTIESPSGTTLPTGLSAFTTYYPVVVSFDLVALSATPSGGAMTYASAGSGSWGIAVDPLRRIRAHAVAAAAEIDQHLTAYCPPIAVDSVTGLYPQFLVALNARMAARAAVTTLQVENPAFKTAVDRLFAQEASDALLLDRLSRGGWPLNPAATDQTTTTEENGARGSSVATAPDWIGDGL